MAAPDIALPPGRETAPPSRSFSLKLRGVETGESIMMFEETVPTGTKSADIWSLARDPACCYWQQPQSAIRIVTASYADKGTAAQIEGGTSKRKLMLARWMPHHERPRHFKLTCPRRPSWKTTVTAPKSRELKRKPAAAQRRVSSVTC
jgi:hypothetical protein